MTIRRFVILFGGMLLAWEALAEVIGWPAVAEAMATTTVLAAIILYAATRGDRHPPPDAEPLRYESRSRRKRRELLRAQGIETWRSARARRP